MDYVVEIKYASSMRGDGVEIMQKKVRFDITRRTNYFLAFLSSIFRIVLNWNIQRSFRDSQVLTSTLSKY